MRSGGSTSHWPQVGTRTGSQEHRAGPASPVTSTQCSRSPQILEQPPLLHGDPAGSASRQDCTTPELRGRLTTALRLVSSPARGAGAMSVLRPLPELKSDGLQWDAAPHRRAFGGEAPSLAGPSPEQASWSCVRISESPVGSACSSRCSGDLANLFHSKGGSCREPGLDGPSQVLQAQRVAFEAHSIVRFLQVF